MSQSNSNPVVKYRFAVPYLAKTDGRSRKFPKGTKVIVLWRGTTDYGECVRVISEEEFIKHNRIAGHPFPRTVFLHPDRVKDVLVIGQETELPTTESYKERLIEMGLLKGKRDSNEPVLFYGKIKNETDKAILIDLADLNEPEWFAKSTIVTRGKLTDRDQHGFEAPHWLLEKKVGEVKAKMFADCRSAIERRLVT